MILSDADYATLIAEAEGQLTTDTNVNWVDIWPTLSGQNFGLVVRGAVAALAAVYTINNSPLSLGSLTTATTQVNTNLDKYDRAVRQLKESNVYKPFGGKQLQT